MKSTKVPEDLYLYKARFLIMVDKTQHYYLQLALMKWGMKARKAQASR